MRRFAAGARYVIMLAGPLALLALALLAAIAWIIGT